MTEYLTATVDKFTFKVAADRLYTADHLWLKEEAGQVRVGLSDYLQQSSGDVAFAEARDEGAVLAVGDELGNIETMKTALSIPAPVGGMIKAVNPRLADEPELINQDPYGEGWLALLAPDHWAADQAALLDAPSYFEKMKAEAETEAKKL